MKPNITLTQKYNIMKYSKKALFILILFITPLVFMSCGILGSDDDDDDDQSDLVGAPGNPRFNLVFDNEDNVDLDLYVTDPNGDTIYFANSRSASGGELDVDCQCGICPNGPNENIFWQSGSAPSGTYTYWVDYFGSCSGSSASSSFTLRVLRNGEIVETRTGSLSSGESQQWQFNM